MDTPMQTPPPVASSVSAGQSPDGSQGGPAEDNQVAADMPATAGTDPIASAPLPAAPADTAPTAPQPKADEPIAQTPAAVDNAVPAPVAPPVSEAPADEPVVGGPAATAGSDNVEEMPDAVNVAPSVAPPPPAPPSVSAGQSPDGSQGWPAEDNAETPSVPPLPPSDNQQL